jgi:hypothetical protein
MKSQTQSAITPISVFLALLVLPGSTSLADEWYAAGARPLPKPGQILKFATQVDVRKRDKSCRVLIDITGTARTEASPQGPLLVVNSVSRLREGDPSCAKTGNAIKRFSYRSADNKLLKVEECKTESPTTCAVRDPLPKDDWQSPESVLDCREGAPATIDTPWGNRVISKLNCTPRDPVPGGGTSPIEFWTDEALFPVYPHLRMKQTLSIPSMGLEMITDTRLIEFN